MFQFIHIILLFCFFHRKKSCDFIRKQTRFDLRVFLWFSARFVYFIGVDLNRSITICWLSYVLCCLSISIHHETSVKKNQTAHANNSKYKTQTVNVNFTMRSYLQSIFFISARRTHTRTIITLMFVTHIKRDYVLRFDSFAFCLFFCSFTCSSTTLFFLLFVCLFICFLFLLALFNLLLTCIHIDICSNRFATLWRAFTSFTFVFILLDCLYIHIHTQIYLSIYVYMHTLCWLWRCVAHRLYVCYYLFLFLFWFR